MLLTYSGISQHPWQVPRDDGPVPMNIDEEAPVSLVIEWPATPSSQSEEAEADTMDWESSSLDSSWSDRHHDCSEPQSPTPPAPCSQATMAGGMGAMLSPSSDECTIGHTEPWKGKAPPTSPQATSQAICPAAARTAAPLPHTFRWTDAEEGAAPPQDHAAAAQAGRPAAPPQGAVSSSDPWLQAISPPDCPIPTSQRAVGRFPAGFSPAAELRAAFDCANAPIMGLLASAEHPSAAPAGSAARDADCLGEDMALACAVSLLSAQDPITTNGVASAASGVQLLYEGERKPVSCAAVPLATAAKPLPCAAAPAVCSAEPGSAAADAEQVEHDAQQAQCIVQSAAELAIEDGALAAWGPPEPAASPLPKAGRHKRGRTRRGRDSGPSRFVDREEPAASLAGVDEGGDDEGGLKGWACKRSRW